MGTLLHHRRQRLRAAADGALSPRPGGGPAPCRPRGPAVPDALRRRLDHARGRVPLPDPPGRERPGGRRAVHRQHRAPVRAGRRGFLRHGGHHGEDLPDRPFRAADRAQLRGRARRALQEGIGPAAAHPGDRDGRDRCRRRLARARRCAGADRGRAGECRRRSRPRLLRPRRHPARRNRREPAARPLRSAAFRRRRAASRSRRGAARDRIPARGGTGPRSRDGGPRHRRDGGREHGQRRPRPCDRVREKPIRTG